MYSNASKGLKLLLFSEMLSIALVILVFFKLPYGVMAILSVVSAAISIFGMYKLSTDIENCQKMMILTGVRMVFSLLADISGLGILSIVSAILQLMIIYYLVNSVGAALLDYGCPNLADLGQKIYKIYFACTVLEIIMSIPILGLLFALFSGLAVIVAELVAGGMYLFYLFKSGNALA